MHQTNASMPTNWQYSRHKQQCYFEQDPKDRVSKWVSFVLLPFSVSLVIFTGVAKRRTRPFLGPPSLESNPNCDLTNAVGNLVGPEAKEVYGSDGTHFGTLVKAGDVGIL